MIRRRLRSLCAFMRNILLSVVLTTTLFLYIPQWLEKYSILEDLSANARRYTLYKETAEEKINTTDIKNLIKKYNLEETILNVEKFGPIRNETPVLVIQVHKYSNSFKYLIASLCDVIGIQDTLLIFSHSYLDFNINKLIQSIDFCRVLQIFYPYSLQVYTHEFPGYSENDCPPSMKIKDAKFSNCIGASTPDIHGRYRHPAKAEKKHFWWWTVNKVFENLTTMEGYTGIVIFIEADLYLLEDFLYMVIYMRNLAKSLPQCEFISMGADLSMLYEDTYRVEFTTWDPKYHSNILGFDSAVWNTIVGHYDLFCVVDDSSWSRSLLHLSLNRRENKRFKVIYSVIPRVIKTSNSHGVVGTNDVVGKVIHALTIQKALKNNMFPPYLEVYTNIELDEDEYVLFDILEGEGGWRDARDVALCSNITVNRVRKLLLDMNIQFQDY